MFIAWRNYKEGDRVKAWGAAILIECPSWRRACTDWLRNAWDNKDKKDNA
jgi:hypothetical protein